MPVLGPANPLSERHGFVFIMCLHALRGFTLGVSGDRRASSAWYPEDCHSCSYDAADSSKGLPLILLCEWPELQDAQTVPAARMVRSESLLRRMLGNRGSAGSSCG